MATGRLLEVNLPIVVQEEKLGVVVVQRLKRYGFRVGKRFTS